MTEEEKWCEQVIILMKVAGMTLTEINTLNDNKRAILSKYFMDSLIKDGSFSVAELSRLLVALEIKDLVESRNGIYQRMR